MCGGQEPRHNHFASLMPSTVPGAGIIGWAELNVRCQAGTVDAAAMEFSHTLRSLREKLEMTRGPAEPCLLSEPVPLLPSPTWAPAFMKFTFSSPVCGKDHLDPGSGGS